MADIGKLTRIKVEGFRSIRSLDLELRPLNVLIGPNGAGKSNLIGFFKFMRSLGAAELRAYALIQGGADKILYFGPKATPILTVGLTFDGVEYSCALSATPAGLLVIADERCFRRLKNGGRLIHLNINEGGGWETQLPPQSALSPAADDPWSLAAKALHGWTTYHFHDTSEQAPVKQTARTNDVAMLRPDGGNLPAFLRLIRERHPAEYAEIVATIRRVAPFFQDFILEPDPFNTDYIRLQWKHVGTDAYFDVSDLSDGTLRFMCLATLLLQPDLPTTILLDEPELGLHPYAVQILAGLMRSAAARTQIIASTQSVTLANQFGWEDLIVCDRVDNASAYRRLEKAEVEAWLEHYQMGDLWQKNLIGGTP